MNARKEAVTYLLQSRASSCGAMSVGHPSGCCPVVLDGILVRGPLVDGSSRLWLAVCIHGELRSVAVILLVLDGILLRGPLIDGSSRAWLAVCIRSKL